MFTAEYPPSQSQQRRSSFPHILMSNDRKIMISCNNNCETNTNMKNCNSISFWQKQQSKTKRLIAVITVLFITLASVILFCTNQNLLASRNNNIISPFEYNVHRRQQNLQTNTNQTNCDSSTDESWVQSIPKGFQFTLIAFLILFSAFFSGLTLSMMGLDTTGLEIVMSGDDPVLSRAASKILPIRQNGNLLLCTLLLGNVAVNTLLGILMADITGGTVGFLTSTGLIVIFGEILPQVSQ